MVGPLLRLASRSCASSAFASVALLAALSLGCTGNASQPAPDAKYLTVFVSKDGEITAGGTGVSLARLEGELDAAKASRAVVLFAREPTERGRGSVAMLVLGAIQQRGLEVRTCAKRDCSDAIGPDGRLSPK